jgi:hypothetical protein
MTRILLILQLSAWNDTTAYQGVGSRQVSTHSDEDSIEDSIEESEERCVVLHQSM